jgi:hypothetical protein
VAVRSDPPEPVQVQWPQTVAVIFNPSSGGDTAGERSARIRQAIQETGKRLIWLETTPEDSGQGLAKDAVGQGADVVIATGGDGTVMACATALAGSEVPLAVLPLGTGNLVAANFDLPTDLDQALEIVLACRRRRIDLGAIGDGRFVIAAGMGFDAAMLRDASHTLKARIGPLAYVWSALRNLRRPRASYRLRLDGGEELTRRAQGVLVANLGKIQGVRLGSAGAVRRRHGRANRPARPRDRSLLPHPGRPGASGGADAPSQARPRLSIDTAVPETDRLEGDEALATLRSIWLKSKLVAPVR